MARLHAEESALTGRALNETFIEGVTTCPADGVCMPSWTRWTVAVERIVRGPVMPRRLIAARLQHGLHVPEYLARSYFRATT